MPQSLAQAIISPSDHQGKVIISATFFFYLTDNCFYMAYSFKTMPPKNPVATGAGKNPPAAQAKCQRTLMNKQQQLSKIHSDLRAYLIGGLLVTQRTEKEEFAKKSSTHRCCSVRATSGRT